MSPEQAEATIRELQDWQAADKLVIGDLMKEAESLRARIAELERDRERVDWLNREAGFFQDDSATQVSVYPDDATCTWHISIGKTKGYGRSIRDAIDAAMQTNPAP